MLARSLDHRGAPLPPWVSSGCDTAVTWALLDRFALLGSPLLPHSARGAGYQGGSPLG